MTIPDNPCTQDVLSRIWYIKTSLGTATGFWASVQGEEYLFTAKHVLEKVTQSPKGPILHETQEGENLQIFINNSWEDFKINKILKSSYLEELDICALGLDRDRVKFPPNVVSPELASSVFYSQDCWILGFPDSWNVDGKEHNCMEIGGQQWLLPIPFVKKALISNLKNKNGFMVFYVDTFANKGFSGGPVIIRDKSDGKWKFAGVISAHKFEYGKIHSSQEQDTSKELSERTVIPADMSTAHDITAFIKDVFNPN